MFEGMIISREIRALWERIEDRSRMVEIERLGREKMNYLRREGEVIRGIKRERGKIRF